MLINRNIVALFALPFMASATASELSIGAGAAYNESPYRGYNENTKAIPLISYEGDSFYVRQTTLGFILSQSEKNELSLTASWMPLEFDPADNDDYAMQQLDKRDSTAMAGVAWYHHERWGTVKASAAADVLDNSNGWVGELSVFHKMQIGRLSLTPALGVLYYDENFSGFAPIFPDTCYHLTHYWPAAADIPVASDNPVHYADAIRYNARTPLQGSLLPLTRLV